MQSRYRRSWEWWYETEEAQRYRRRDRWQLGVLLIACALLGAGSALVTGYVLERL